MQKASAQQKLFCFHDDTSSRRLECGGMKTKNKARQRFTFAL
jgi:hypothetical protein